MTRSTGLSKWERKRVGRTKGSPGRHLESPLLSIDEACEYTRLARSVFYERLHEFDQVKLGKRRFITKASADEYIRRNTKAARVTRDAEGVSA
jgi:hypothetical protein